MLKRIFVLLIILAFSSNTYSSTQLELLKEQVINEIKHLRTIDEAHRREFLINSLKKSETTLTKAYKKEKITREDYLKLLNLIKGSLHSLNNISDKDILSYYIMAAQKTEVAAGACFWGCEFNIFHIFAAILVAPIAIPLILLQYAIGLNPLE